MTYVLKEPVSPCIGICRLDPQVTHCVGCLRTIDEIRGWPDLSREDRRALLTDLEQRRARVREQDQA